MHPSFPWIENIGKRKEAHCIKSIKNNGDGLRLADQAAASVDKTAKCKDSMNCAAWSTRRLWSQKETWFVRFRVKFTPDAQFYWG